MFTPPRDAQEARAFTNEITAHFGHEWILRLKALALSPEALATLIPHGSYCYPVVETLPPPAIGHRIAPCSFLIGSRPETTCFEIPTQTMRSTAATISMPANVAGSMTLTLYSKTHTDGLWP